VSAASNIPEIESADEVVLEELLLEADEARQDVAKFFEFVLRDEQLGLPIKVIPLQRLIFEFVEANRNCVLMIPVNHGKSFTLGGYILWKLGQNAMLKAAVVSAAEGQARRPLQSIRQYVESSNELRFVYPDLRKSARAGEPWTMTELTINRPPGIGHPTLVARGQDSTVIRGSRWDFCLVDDMSNEENTNTPEQREKTYRFLSSTLFTRMEPGTGQVVVTCVALHQEDTTHRLMMSKAEGGPGWAGMIMRSDGTIILRNCHERVENGRFIAGFDSALIRPDDDLDESNPMATYRLVAHDHLPEAERTLWPERWSRALLDEQRDEMHPVEFERNYNNICRDDSTALCKQEYVDRALALGRKLGIKRMCTNLDDFVKVNGIAASSIKVFGGVDLAFSQSSAADECAIFLIGVIPNESGKGQIRIPIWCESGKWGSDELMVKLVSVDERFVHVPYGFENNGAQEGVRKLMVTAEKSLVLKEHTTGATKNSIQLGVPSIFGEMANGAWAIPNEGRPLEGALKKWVDQSLHYVPSAHTGDLLMASLFARDLAKRFGAITRAAMGNKRTGPGGGAASLLRR
jgi:hypothetical protein